MSLEDQQQYEDFMRSQIANGSASEEQSQQIHDIKETASKKLRDAAGFIAFWQRKAPDLTLKEIEELAIAQGIELRSDMAPIRDRQPQTPQEIATAQRKFNELLAAEGMEDDRATYREYSDTEYGIDQADLQERADGDRTYEPKKRAEAETAASDAVMGERARRGRTAKPQELTEEQREQRSKITINGQERYLSHGLETITGNASDRDPIKDEFISRKGKPIEFEKKPLDRQTIINALIDAESKGIPTTPDNLEDVGSKPVFKRRTVSRRQVNTSVPELSSDFNSKYGNLRYDKSSNQWIKRDNSGGQVFYPSAENEGVFRPEMDPGRASRKVLGELQAKLDSGSLSPDEAIKAQAVIKRLSASSDPRGARDADRAEAQAVRLENRLSSPSAATEADNALEAFLLGKRRSERGDVNLDRLFRLNPGLMTPAKSRTDFAGFARDIDPSRMPVAGYAYPGAPAQDKLTLQALGRELEADPLTLQRLGNALQTGSALANAPTTGQALNAPNNNPPQTLVDLMADNFDPSRQVTNISGELALLAERAGKGLKGRDGRVYTPLPSSGIRSYEEAEAVLGNLLSQGQAAGVNFGTKGEPVKEAGINHLLRNNLHYSSTETKNLVNALAQLSLAQGSGVNQAFKDSYQGGGRSTPYRDEAVMQSVDLGATGPNIRFGMDQLPTERPGVGGILKTLQPATDSERARFAQFTGELMEGTQQEKAEALYDAKLPYKAQLAGDTSRNAKRTRDPEGSILGAERLRRMLQETTKPGKRQSQAEVNSMIDRWVSESEGIRERQAQTEAQRTPSIPNIRGRVDNLGQIAPKNNRPSGLGERNEEELDRLAGPNKRNSSAAPSIQEPAVEREGASFSRTSPQMPKRRVGYRVAAGAAAATGLAELINSENERRRNEEQL